MSQDRRDRLNAAGQAATGGAMVGAGMAANHGMDAVLERKGLKTPGKALWAAARRKPGGKLSGLHAAHVAGRVVSRGVQAAGLPLLAYGSYNAAQPGGTVARVKFKDDVLRSSIDHTTGRASVRQAKRQLRANKELRAAQRKVDRLNAQVGKSLDERERSRLVRRKRIGRDLSLAGGTIGATALALRAPEAARGLMRVKGLRSSRVLGRVAAKEPQATKTSNALLAVGAGTGAAGAFNYAAQQKLEAKDIRKALSDADYRRYQTKGERRSTRIQVVGGTLAATGAALSAPFVARSGVKDVVRGSQSLADQFMMSKPGQKGLPSNPGPDRVIKPNRQGVYDITGRPEPKGKPYVPPGMKQMARGRRKFVAGLGLAVGVPVAAAANNVRLAQLNTKRVQERKRAAVGKAGFTSAPGFTSRIRVARGWLERQSKNAPVGFMPPATFKVDAKGRASRVGRGRASERPGDYVTLAQVSEAPKVAQPYAAKVRKEDRRKDLVEAGVGAGLVTAGIKGNKVFDAARGKAEQAIDAAHRRAVAPQRRWIPVDEMGRPAKRPNSKGSSYFHTRQGYLPKDQVKARRKQAAGAVRAANETRNNRLRMVRRASGFRPRAAVMSAAMMGGTGLMWHGARTGLEKAVSRQDVDAAMTGGVLGAAGYHGALYATKPIDRKYERQLAQSSPKEKAVDRQHKKAHGLTGKEPAGDTRYLRYFRTYPKSLPGWKWKRAMSYAQGGKTGVALSGAAAAATGAAFVHSSRQRRNQFAKAADIRVDEQVPPLWVAVKGLEF